MITITTEDDSLAEHEMQAIRGNIRNTTNGATITLSTTSFTINNTLGSKLKKWEDEGFPDVPGAHHAKAIAAELRARKTHTLVRDIEHAAINPLVQSAKSAAKNALGQPPPWPVREPQECFMVDGMKLAIRKIKTHKTDQREATRWNMEEALDRLQDTSESRATAKEVWRGMKSPHIIKGARGFMWLAMHDGYMTGDRWLKTNMSEEYKERGMCKNCIQVESMNHILFHCEEIGQEMIWKLLTSVWSEAGLPKMSANWGSVLAPGIASPESGERPLTGHERRLWTILTTECDRVIEEQGEAHTAVEVTNRWYAAMNGRLALDRRTRRGAGNVAKIWLPILNDRDRLPEDWVLGGGGLVGIRKASG
ncbi:uncharacterized protein BXZ73DRAFT_93591 [Epithele typhae]|uniref:uncharacterized protein n=1 Tax=Epithele typhae TaxID=378194 RepID=UPI00200789E1|nr:uncharacterized protein BXZ73DRAFT_93591 [Epithele typhae]KAH9910756.1 hypothetical protein BXZ73DRAFT_93591 [Epithele typhae]